jgi:hypothetical protein
MIAKRLMLPEDKAFNLNRLVRAGIATGVLEPQRNASNQP